MIHLSIVTPERQLFSEAVNQVTLTTESGEITVLPHHIPLVTILKPGELRYKKNSDEYALAVTGGFAEVRGHNSLVILADSAEFAPDIDVAEAAAARDRALKLMQEDINKDSADYARLQSTLERELLRLKVGNKYRKLPGT